MRINALGRQNLDGNDTHEPRSVAGVSVAMHRIVLFSRLVTGRYNLACLTTHRCFMDAESKRPCSIEQGRVAINLIDYQPLMLSKRSLILFACDTGLPLRIGGS